MTEANRLIHERSPYLQQHAHNPVDWYPWGEEAFAKARQEGKPIFLSIGYATCHWCHVMERESFEDPAIGRLLNQSFVSIKVDREEHPDVDQVYMQAVMLLGGHGGWPLTVFLTPELTPFFGGTYFPPERRGNFVGLKELLPNIAQAWKARRPELTASAQELTKALQQSLAGAPQAGVPEEALLHQAFQQAAGAFDPVHGGFGDAPKFPRPVELSFLLRYASRVKKPEAQAQVEATLERMARGGIRDQVGGGFHRYATDAEWRVPHFEKMLYDQALLAKAYLEAHQVTRRPAYAAIAREIFTYVLRDLTGPEGAFYTAEDADSEGEEGKFYVWTPQEISEVLGAAEAERFCRAYGVTAEGNFEHGASILHLPPEADLVADAWASARARLLARRAQRPRPLRDDKVLTSWNGLMIGAFAYGGATLEEPTYLAAAEQAATMIWERLRTPEGLLRRYRQGEAKYSGGLEDYAFLAHGLLELYQAGGQPRWLQAALALATEMNQRFWDAAQAGWFTRDAQQPPLIVRAKDLYDGATPSGNSMALLVNLWLARLTGAPEWETHAAKALAQGAALVAQAPFGFPQYLSALDHWLGPAQEIVLAGDPAAPQTHALRRVVRQHWLPRAVVVQRPIGGPEAEALEQLLPWVRPQGLVKGQPAAYVCERFACRQPVSEPAQLTGLLDSL